MTDCLSNGEVVALGTAVQDVRGLLVPLAAEDSVSVPIATSVVAILK